MHSLRSYIRLPLRSCQHDMGLFRHFFTPACLDLAGIVCIAHISIQNSYNALTVQTEMFLSESSFSDVMISGSSTRSNRKCQSPTACARIFAQLKSILGKHVEHIASSGSVSVEVLGRSMCTFNRRARITLRPVRNELN